MRRRTQTLTALALLLALAPAPGPAQTMEGLGIDELRLIGEPQATPLAGAELERAVQELGSKLRCPICQSQSVADQSSTQAITMLAQIRDLLSRGYSSEQITDYFVGSYGEFVLLQPRAEGFNLLVWIAPLVALVIGAALVVRRLQSPAKAATAREDDADLDRYLERVRSEVGSHRSGKTHG